MKKIPQKETKKYHTTDIAKKDAVPVKFPTSNIAQTEISGSGLNRYLNEIKRFPMLGKDEEFMLAKSFKDKNDISAAHKLITSHLRLVAKIAIGYRGYGLPSSEVISEGNIGLMQAVKRFEPEKGFRLATYAMWWIKAAIQEYVLRSWSLIKIGTTAAQKKLFFNLKKVRQKIGSFSSEIEKVDEIKKIAQTLNVSEKEVINMNNRLSGDKSLNAPLTKDGDANGEWQDWLVDETISAENKLIEVDEHDFRMVQLTQAMSTLKPREKQIFKDRRLLDEPKTLEVLANKHGVSRERIRQIENRAFEKIQNYIKGYIKGKSDD